MNREDVAMDLTFENLDILRKEVQAAKLLLSECDKVLEEDGGVYIELRAFLSGKMDADDVIALLASQHGEQAIEERNEAILRKFAAWVDDDHTEQAEGAQGVAINYASLHEYACSVGVDYNNLCAAVRAALAQPSPKCATCNDSEVVSTTDVDHNGDHIEIRCPICTQPSKAPSYLQVSAPLELLNRVRNSWAWTGVFTNCPKHQAVYDELSALIDLTQPSPAPELRGMDLVHHVGELIEGKTVSLDVSTGDHDAGNRLFATVCEVMADGDGFTILAVDPKPNFEAPEPELERPRLKVWSAAMPESNGKSNFTAILMREGGDICDGFTIARSEYPDRVRYEADCVRWLIGEIAEKPFILDYDANKHSGYKAPVARAGQVPAIPQQWAKSLSICWPKYLDDKDGDWCVGTVDEDGRLYEVLLVEASQYDAPGESQKIAEAIVALWSFAAAPAQGGSVHE